jgi:hypothetical protein
MRWPWSKRHAMPEIPPFEPQPPIVVHPKPKDQGLVVEEIDTSAMTRTGVHKAWKRLTGQ